MIPWEALALIGVGAALIVLLINGLTKEIRERGQERTRRLELDAERQKEVDDILAQPVLSGADRAARDRERRLRAEARLSDSSSTDDDGGD